MIKWLKLILLVILLSCKPKKGHITLGPGSLGAGAPNPVVTSLQVTSDQLIINGSNLQGVVAVAMTTTTRAAYNKNFNVLSASINQVVAVAVDSIKIPMNTALNLILNTAHAQSSVPIEFALPPDSVSTPEIEDGAVTAAKIEDNSITTSKIGNQQVTFNKLQPGPLSGGQTVITWNPATQQYYLAASGGGGGTAGVSDITIGNGIVGQNPASPPTVNGLVPIGVDIAVGGSPLDIKIPFFNNVNEIELNWGAPGISNKPAKILLGNGPALTSHYSISNQADIFTISWENPAVKKIFEIDAAGNVSALGGGGALQSVCLEDGTGCPTAPPTGVTQIITTAPLTGSGTGIVTIGPGAINTANNLVQLDSFGNLPAALNIPTMASNATGQFQPIFSGGPDKTQISAPYKIPEIACTDGQILKADSNGDFICANDAGGVISFNGRNGVVTPTAGDYTASEITNVAFPGPVGDIDATNVQGALDELSTEKLPKAGGTMTGTITTTTQNAIQIGPTGEIRFVEPIVSGTEYVGFKASDNDLASNVIWTLPSDAGSAGQVLATTATNTLYWTTISGGVGTIGDVVGPASATPSNIAMFADASGKIIQDGGKAASALVTGLGPTGLGNVAIFNSTDGTAIQDSNIYYTRVVQGPSGATSTNLAIPIWDGTSGNALLDSGILASNIVTGPASVPLIGTLPSFSSLSGKEIQDTNILASRVVQGPSSATSTNQAIPIWNGTSGNALSDSAFIINGPVLIGGTDPGKAAIGTPIANEACFFNSNNEISPAICQSSAGKTKITSDVGQITDFILGSATALSLTATATVNYGAIISNTNTANAIQINPFGAAANNTGQLRFMELAAGGANYVGFKAPDAISADVIWTLPAANGTAGQALTWNASGVLSWATPVSSANGQTGTSYTLLNSDCGNTVSLSNISPITLNLGTLPAGCVVNVIQANTGVVTVVNGTITRQNAFGLYRTRTQFSVISIQVDGSNGVISGDVN